MTAKGSGDVGGQNPEFEAGAVFTGDAGYINWQGTDYKLSPQQYASLSNALGQSSSQSDTQGQGSLPGLKDSLGDLTNEGETDVDGTKTIHVSGNVDPRQAQRRDQVGDRPGRRRRRQPGPAAAARGGAAPARPGLRLDQ